STRLASRVPARSAQRVSLRRWLTRFTMPPVFACAICRSPSTKSWRAPDLSLTHGNAVGRNRFERVEKFFTGNFGVTPDVRPGDQIAQRNHADETTLTIHHRQTTDAAILQD